MVQKRSGTPGVSLPHGQVKTISPSATKRPTIQAERLPHGILALIFRYLSLNDLVACMRVCRSWLAYLDNEDSVTWRALCLRSVPESALGDPYLLVDAASWKAKLRAYAHAWNPLDCSRYPNAGIEEEKQLQRERGEMVGEKLRVCLDCDQHLMWFERGSQFLGVAFRHLPPVRLYPAVCAVYGNTEVSMVYTGPPLDG